MLLLEGIVQILVAVTIFITILRRGKNRLLFALGWFFMAVGIFSLGPYLPEFMKLIPGVSMLIAYSSVICHTSVFFGVAGYCSFQFGILKGNKFIRTAFIVGLTAAFTLIFIHILSLDVVNAGSSRVVFEQISETLMYSFFIISLAFITFIFFSLAWQLRKEKGAVNYITTTGLGLGLMLIALVMRKALDLMMPPLDYAIVDLLSFVALGLVVAGTALQSSAAMSPGFIFDAKTKAPVPLATVSILRASDNKLLESRITKNNGHYGLLLEPGEYKITVSAKGYSFPARNAVYKGENFTITMPTILAKDIALDPENS